MFYSLGIRKRKSNYNYNESTLIKYPIGEFNRKYNTKIIEILVKKKKKILALEKGRLEGENEKRLRLEKERLERENEERKIEKIVNIKE